MEQEQKKRKIEKEMAAEKRRRTIVAEHDHNDRMLATVTAVKVNEIQTSTVELQSWKEALKEEKWPQPKDWNMVTERTLPKYIPFEEEKIGQTFAYKYIKTRLGQAKSPHIVQGPVTADTPLCNLTNNQLRKAIYRAAIEKSNIGTISF